MEACYLLAGLLVIFTYCIPSKDFVNLYLFCDFLYKVRGDLKKKKKEDSNGKSLLTHSIGQL